MTTTVPRFLSSPVALVLGWIAAHLVPVMWIATAGTSTGDVRYYFAGITGANPAAMDEYPEVGTWPARAVEVVTGGLSGRDTPTAEDSFVFGFVALCLLMSAVFTWYLWRAGRRGAGRATVWPAWFWVLFAGLSGPIFLTRLDIFPGLLVAAFAALLLAGTERTRWPRAATVLLAAATMIKLWPGVLGAALVAGWRRSGTWSRVTWFFGSLVALCGVVGVTVGVDRLISPLTYQGDRGLQVESVAATPWVAAAAVHGLISGNSTDNPWSVSYATSQSYEISGPGVAATLVVTTVLTAAVIVLALGWAAMRLSRDDWSPRQAVVFSMMLIMLIIVTNKVFSPQYLVWIAPVAAVALLVSRQRIAITVTVQILVAAALTTLVYPVFYDWLISNPPYLIAAGALVLRNIVVVALAVTCTRWAFSAVGTPRRRRDPAPEAHAGAAS